MGDRRILLGTSAVLVGLSSALITGTAVAAADSGDTDSRQADNSAAPAAGSDSVTSTSTPRRAATPQRTAASPAPSAATGDAPSQQASSTTRGQAGSGRVRPPVESNNSAPLSVSDSQPAARVVSQTAERAAPDAVVAPPTATDAAPAPAATVVAAPNPAGVTTTVASVASAPAAAAYAAPAPTPAPAAGTLYDILSGFGWQPEGGVLAATPALAAFSGQRASAAPAAVVGTAQVAAAPPDPNLAAAAALLPALPTNGVTGVQVGHSQLTMPGAFIGDSVRADWYFPTLADGSVDAQGVIWLQHGFAATNTFYSALATDLAMKTNSIVVAPTLSSIPFTFSGGCLICASSQQAAAEILLDPDRAALVTSAVDAGYTGDVNELLGTFALSGHSAGGGFASAVAYDYITEGSIGQDANLIGVVMYDGVSNGAFDGSFTQQVQTLAAANKPLYQIAAPAQIWNAFGATTNQLLAARPDTFDGAVLVGGSHVDSMLGVNPLFDAVLQLVAGRVPAGNTAATYTLSTGWLNDMYAGATPGSPQYGLYAAANQQIIMGNAAAVALPTPFANQLTPIGGVLKSVTDFVFGLLGVPPTPVVNTGSNGITALVTPPKTNGVTGVKTSSSTLTIPSGNGYNAPADWYFPTQADGSVQANGVIWLQHGFLGFSGWYSDLATRLAQETNSIVVAPSIFWFDDAYTGEAAAQMFVGARPELNISANAAGFQGDLPQQFLLTGHSAGGRFAATAGGYTVDNGAAADLLGVVMFDGVDGSEQFAASLAKLDSLDIPLYQIAAPPQSWNSWGGTTEQLAQLHPGQFIGTMIDNGSHTDSIGGDSFFGWLGEIGSNIFVKPSPPGGKAAVGTFATGWINDIYAGLVPTDPQPKFGIYGVPNNGLYQPNRPIVMGEAGATTLPAPPPVVINPLLPPSETYLGTWYEQGSVKQFFSIGLVNTKAVYSLNPDGTIKVENSGNYFGPNGPESNIVGSAVPVNSPTNTRLDVGFFFGQPNSREPGNYWILDYDPNYEWAIVSDSTGSSGFILTRDQTISEQEYNDLVARAKQLGVTGRITPTAQYPSSSSAAALPGPATLPATVRV